MTPEMQHNVQESLEQLHAELSILTVRVEELGESIAEEMVTLHNLAERLYGISKVIREDGKPE